MSSGGVRPRPCLKTTAASRAIGRIGCLSTLNTLIWHIDEQAREAIEAYTFPSGDVDPLDMHRVRYSAFQLLDPAFDGVAEAMTADDLGDVVFGKYGIVAGSVCHPDQ